MRKSSAPGLRDGVALLSSWVRPHSLSDGRHPSRALRSLLLLLCLLLPGIRPSLQAFTFTRTSAPVFYIDTSVTPTLQATYAAYQIHNESGVYYPDIWARIDSFSGGSISLGPHEDGVVHLGSLGPGQTKTAFFYLQASQETSVPQSHTVRLYSTRPPAPELASQNFTMTVEETIQANANQVDTVVAGPNPPQLGGLVTVTVRGRSGTIGAAGAMVFNPAAYLSWRPDAYKLVTTSLELSGGNTGTYTDTLFVFGEGSSDTDYTAVYTYRTVATTQTPTPVSAISFISSGTQIKHTRVENYVQFDPILPADNRMTLGKTANPTQLFSGGLVTFALVVTNSGLHDTILEDLIDTLPSAPGSPVFLSGSARFQGVPIPDPVINGSLLTWVGTYDIPAGTIRSLTFQVTFPDLPGTYTNRAVAHIGSSQIDTTLGTLDNAPATATVVVRIPIVSGAVYLDQNRNAQKDSGEQGTGLALFAKLIPDAAAGGPAGRAARVDATTGHYAFTNVAPGRYWMVIDDNALLSDVTPALPAGWIGTEMPDQVRTNVIVATTDVPDLNFGLIGGAILSGTVFHDTGAGGGLAHDGTRNGAEPGRAGVTVRLTDASGATTYDSASTDGNGQYTLFLPATLPDGMVLNVTETNPNGDLSVAATVGNTGGTYDRAADTITFTLQTGTTYTNVHFGDVPPNSFVPNNQLSGLPGSIVVYAHTFTAGSAGQVAFLSSSQATPSLPGWSHLLYHDVDCNGQLDPTDPALLDPVTLGAGEPICILVKVFIPLEAPFGAQDIASITASFDYVGSTPPLSTSHLLTDVTTVGNPTTAGLTLIKSADKATAMPGEVITYTITYANTSHDPLRNLVLYDSTPAYTTFLSATNGPLATNLTGVVIQTPPAGTAGNLQWRFSGALAPGRSGIVRFQVELQR